MAVKGYFQFPYTRLRRPRMHAWSRAMVAETSLAVTDLIMPFFVQYGDQQKDPIDAMPGVFRYSIDLLIEEVKQVRDLGIPAVAIFPVTPQDDKTECGKEALNPDNLVCQAVWAIKKEVPDIGVICDVALDPYTTHGHDGIIVDGNVANDESVEILVKQALNQARAGCDIIAPSDMQDGRVGAIRTALERAGFKDVMILAYTAKYASAFYEPFREAIGTDTNLSKGDKKSYQQDPANSDESMREAHLDISEGADILMVKPALPYLDIIYRLKQAYKMPIFAYQVSGEYAMLAHLGPRALWEATLSTKRAGADAIFTYAAKEIAQFIG